jgi:hypothetical protein
LRVVRVAYAATGEDWESERRAAQRCQSALNGGMRASRDACESNPEVEALPSHNPLQYLHLTSAQVRSEKLLSVSAATHHVMQLLLVKSPLTPRCTIRESSASAIVHLVGRHGRAIQFGFGSEARVRRALTE